MTYEEYQRLIDKSEKIARSIAPCGLACELCGERTHCKGCNFSNDDEVKCQCHQRICSRAKNLHGCWECDNFPCNKDMFDTNHHSYRLISFVEFVKRNSLTYLAECLINNEQNGIIYHRDHENHTGDYDSANSVDEVIELLLKGLNQDNK